MDRLQLIENLIHIDNKEGLIVPFQANRLQRYFYEHKSNRNIILKFRQGGCSSFILVDMFCDCITIPHTQCAVVSHETHSTQRLLDRVQFYYDGMDEPKPVIGAESRSEKTFPELHSSIYVGTAGARAFGHGDTIRKALLSEMSLYEDGEKVLNGVEDAVPLTGELTIECYDERTEVLTDTGWKLFSQLTEQDLLLSKDPETNKAKYLRPASYQKFKRVDKMISFKGERFDLLVTPGHSMWASKRDQKLSFHKASDIAKYSEFSLDSSMIWEGKEQEFFALGDKLIPMDLWLEFIGYFLSEGWVEPYAVSIYQDSPFTPIMWDCMRKIAPYFNRVAKKYNYDRQFAIPGKELASYLRNYTMPKRIPRELLNLSRRQLQILLSAYWKGDGEQKRPRCCTKDIELKDGLQELCLKLGYEPSCIFRTFRDGRSCWNINLNKQKLSCRLIRGQVTELDYDGFVYDVTLPEYHLLLVRRNGKAVWSGNCTPQGEDNAFYGKWTRAREGKSPYKPFFFPWWWNEGYTIPRGSELVLPIDQGELSYTGEEIELRETYKRYIRGYPGLFPPELSEGQIRWRRWKIGEKEGLFWQEYPEDEVSCFITIGDPVFDSAILTGMAQGAYAGKTHAGGWTFWLPPTEKGKYVIGADSSAGAPGGSYSAAVVLDEHWQVCATFQARLDPAEFAAILVQMGKWYNRAEIAVERNFTGYAVLGHMTTYPNIYMQRDFVTGKVTTQKGWWTNDQTRQYMMTAGKDHLAQIKIWDVNLIRQLRGYRFIKYKATPQTFDDLAMAMLIAVAAKKISGVAKGYRGSVPGWSGSHWN